MNEFKKKLMVGVVVGIAVFIPWFLNIYKFSNCDFKSSYKCEAIHGAGVFVPPVSYITVWFDSDKGN